jgi:ABC-type lipoprotein release transport system permease subunit
LGATPRDLMALGLGSGARQTIAGLALGVIAALVLTRALRALLQGVTPTDPTTFTAVVVLTAIVAIAASAVPARRAGRVDPNEALRAE